MKGTWVTIKEIIVSKLANGNLFPKRVPLNDFETLRKLW